MTELVHPTHIFVCGNEPQNAVRFITAFQVNVLEVVRNYFNKPVLMNNYHYGGDNVGKGTRAITYRPKGGSLTSDHYTANAVDPTIENISPEEFFLEATKHGSKLNVLLRSVGVNTIEDVTFTPTWNHLGRRNFWTGEKDGYFNENKTEIIRIIKP